MNGLSSRLVASTSCGRTSPRRSMVLDMISVSLWSYRNRSGIALPRPSHAVGSNGGEGPDPTDGRPGRADRHPRAKRGELLLMFSATSLVVSAPRQLVAANFTNRSLRRFAPEG